MTILHIHKPSRGIALPAIALGMLLVLVFAWFFRHHPAGSAHEVAERRISKAAEVSASRSSNSTRTVVLMSGSAAARVHMLSESSTFLDRVAVLELGPWKKQSILLPQDGYAADVLEVVPGSATSRVRRVFLPQGDGSEVVINLARQNRDVGPPFPRAR